MLKNECVIKWAIDNARTVERVTGEREHYCLLMQTLARNALAAANRSGNARRRGAAMRALNYYGREASKASQLRAGTCSATNKQKAAA